jgi:hypothetical protein
MENWKKDMGLGAFDGIREMQEKLQMSINPFIKQQNMLSAVTKNSGLQIAQNQISKNLSGLSMLSEISKNFKNYTFPTSSNFSEIAKISESINWKNNFTIPQSTFDAINSINKNYEHLFENLNSPIKFQSPDFTQIKNLNVALSGISAKIAEIAIQQKNWSILEDFETVTEKALEFSETIDNSSEKEQQRQFEILQSLVVTFYRKHKTLGISALKVVEIFIIIITLHQYYDFLKIKPELATKENIQEITEKQDSFLKEQDSISKFIKHINQQLKEAKQYRITNRICKVKLKPKIRTLTLNKLPVNFEVIVIQIHHKWVYVSYFDKNDNLPQTGWILKKYLNKPK